MSKKLLVISDYWIGDTIKTQTACKRLKEEGQADEVHFLIKWPQLEVLCSNHPYIDKVIVTNDIEFTLNQIKHEYSDFRRNMGPEWRPVTTPGYLYQKHCGVREPENDFDVYTDKETDELIKQFFDTIRKNNPGKLLVGFDLSWRGLSTREGIIKHLPISDIIRPLEDDYVLVPIGLPHKNGQPVQIHSAQNPDQAKEEFTRTASKIKNLDVLLTSESGISNLAIGIKTTPIIYTKDFLYGLAGPKGNFGSSPHPEKIMGPLAYGKCNYVDCIDQKYGDEDYVEQFKISLEKYAKSRSKI